MALIGQLYSRCISVDVFSPAVSMLLVNLARPHPRLVALPYSTGAGASNSEEGEAGRVLGDGGPAAAAVAGGPAAVVKRKFWRRNTRRTGVIAIKVGMTQLWDKSGQPIATTVLQVSKPVHLWEPFPLNMRRVELALCCYV